MDIRTEPCAPSRRRWLTRSAALAASAACGLHAWPAAANELKLGQPAPPLLLHTLDGRQIASRELLGQVVLATFWATWCEPCIEELPLLSTYAQSHARQGLQVLGFSLDAPEQLPRVRQMAEHLSFPVGLLGSPWVGGYGRIWKIPVSFVIDRKGLLAHNGWDDAQPEWTAERLRKVMDPLLASAA